MNNTLLYVITVLIWGTTWIAINYQLGDVPPEASIVYRFGLAAILLFAYCRFKKLSLAFNRKQHLQFLFFGLMLFGCNYYFLYSAQQHINSALTSIAFSMIMFFNVINARIWFQTKITRQTYLGAFLGLMGIVVLFWPQINDTELGTETLLGLSLCFVGTLFASTGNMVSMKNKLMNLPMMQANAWGMFYGSIFMTILLKSKTLLSRKAFKGWVSALSVVTDDLQPMSCLGGVLLSSMVEKSLQHHLVKERRVS